MWLVYQLILRRQCCAAAAGRDQCSPLPLYSRKFFSAALIALNIGAAGVATVASSKRSEVIPS